MNMPTPLSLYLEPRTEGDRKDETCGEGRRKFRSLYLEHRTGDIGLEAITIRPCGNHASSDLLRLRRERIEREREEEN
jgi:hypothetical protein